jgi:hypothetical protein
MTPEVTANELGTFPVVLEPLALFQETLGPRKTTGKHYEKGQRSIRNSVGVLARCVDERQAARSLPRRQR